MQRHNMIFWLIFVKNQPKKTYIKSQLISKGNEKIDFSFGLFSLALIIITISLGNFMFSSKIIKLIYF